MPVAALLLFAIPRYIARDRPYLGPKRRYDLPGALLLTAGMLLLVRTIVEAPTRGWGAPETIAGFVLAVGLLAAFVAVERRTSQPLVRLGIFRSAPLVRANLGAMCLFGAYVGFQFVATLYLQTTLGWSALETALAFLPGGLLVAFGAPRMGARDQPLRHRASRSSPRAIAFAPATRSSCASTRRRTCSRSCRRCC